MRHATERDERRRQIVAVVALVLVVVLSGCSALFGPPAGRGDVTVTVVDQRGTTVDHANVVVADEKTGERVFQGNTHSDGEVRTSLEHGKYVVKSSDVTKTVTVTDDTQVSLRVTRSPPNAAGSNARAGQFGGPYSSRAGT